MSEILQCEHILGLNGRPIQSSLVFALTPKETLNSNSLPNNTFFLGKLKRVIRDKGAFLGSSWHTDTSLALASVELSEIIKERNHMKSTVRKSMNKDGLSKDEQSVILADVDENYKDEISSLSSIVALHSSNKDDNDTPYLYDSCTISIGVSPPTKRVIDPPNLYPTIKPFVDGLTDALWWKDDNFNYITSTEFHYVNPNPHKMYVFYLDIKKGG